MMARRFKKFFKKKGGFQKGESSHKKDYKKERAPVCFECKKPGHFKAECPSLQRVKGKDKRKAFVSSIWVNSSDEETNDEEEVANLCLVAREDGEEASSDFDSIHGDEVTLTELQEAYNDIHREFFRLCKAYKVLRIKNESIEFIVNSLCYELAEAKKLPVVDTKGNPQVEPNASVSESCTNCSKISIERDRLYNALQKFTTGSENTECDSNEPKSI